MQTLVFRVQSLFSEFLTILDNEPSAFESAFLIFVYARRGSVRCTDTLFEALSEPLRKLSLKPKYKLTHSPCKYPNEYRESKNRESLSRSYQWHCFCPNKLGRVRVFISAPSFRRFDHKPVSFLYGTVNIMKGSDRTIITYHLSVKYLNLDVPAWKKSVLFSL